MLPARLGPKTLPRALKMQVKSHLLVLFHPHVSMKSPTERELRVVVPWGRKAQNVLESQRPPMGMAGSSAPRVHPSTLPLHWVHKAEKKKKKKKSNCFPSVILLALAKEKKQIPWGSFPLLNSQKVVLHQNSFPMKGKKYVWSWSQGYRHKSVEPLLSSAKPEGWKAENQAPLRLKYLLETGRQEGERKIMFERRWWLFKGWEGKLYLQGHGINLTTHLTETKIQLGTQTETSS